ncbi:metallophosphoesterase [Clostridium luticellarii]|uniref:3',5'-cyclic adenosine monophosphate phosphodiesterase CpdA n=1 Tax=Clostridium luticellarii TaxID=1691940 RepID=A0A2T0BQK2_9CLOT|nr:metallophosphoesterase [Clostridium luticellarii]MCI1944790.1 metallophosphoesterase [Clostridium luticellarii]MCI1968285.1 metallophosphoesterase [Clostridium luticellarii]MCI1995678.1 metallophosphoesterase [Clostridium luticellarii]MCI2040242.1 metallophosphoesterase [Clostridium luticellarii]PRR86160.1 3',5'-cyclic adenosine monophosphate phosphodiesterase CpdA [Clostridium luticellarii]
MALFAISDLHLDMTGNKPMDIFGDNWIGHDEKIKSNWIDKVKDEDTVLIAGDMSWSMNMGNGFLDLEWIHDLPGRKVMVKGNHDYWWGSITKLNNLYEDMDFIQNNFFVYKDYALCGTRGWSCPGSENFSQHDEKIYNRELMRMRNSLSRAEEAGYSKFIVLIHYPPIGERFMNSGFRDIFEEYSVEKVIYGHIHGNASMKAETGELNGVEYILTSADYIDFDPKIIIGK